MKNKLEFGTAGIRGKVGFGEDKLNYAHVQRIVHGFAKYLINKFPDENIRVVIGRDNRIKSFGFSVCCARILNSYGIEVIYSKDISPTPFVSFCILEYKAHGGINITASHNPKEYNGIKLYNNMASQCLPEEIKEISSYFNEYDSSLEKYNYSMKLSKSNCENLTYISKEVKNKYLDEVAKVGGIVDIKNVKLSYSPLHGTGNKFVPELLEKIGFNINENINQTAFFVKEQMIQTPHFTNVNYPNPEKKDAFDLLIKLGKKTDSDILLMTDPDSDRVGLAVKYNNTYKLLNGNETATIIFNYLLEQNKSNDFSNQYLIYSFVSSNIPAILAEKNKINTHIVPTGFKWIGMLINKFEAENQRCFLAFEESYGSLINQDLARDKDALQSVVILAKMSSFYKKHGKTLIDVLNDIYDEVGYVASENVEITVDENTNLKELQEKFMDLPLNNKVITNYNEKTGYMKANMIKMEFSDDHSWLALRPSGTEPKIKFYVFAFDKNQELANKKLLKFKEIIWSILQK
ncbi:phospho-sugar mutase [Mycoplasmopsis felifaucium]|uniref:phospho-sugar mutase n=1 Tax=Mycoplasmopsis felifaucium TaxID=35768 RepID=UPI0004882530|nr:phospho-sugar mutase [Mycoplasmopsis felifaucium]